MSRSGRGVLRLVPASRRASIEAARAEAEALSGTPEAVRWRAAARWMLVRAVVVHAGLILLATATVVAAVATVNESGSDVANQVTLLSILAGAGVLGWLWRAWAWVPGIVVGATVAVEHLVALALNLPEPEVSVPAGWAGVASLLILCVPALLAAYLGAGARRLASRS